MVAGNAPGDSPKGPEMLGFHSVSGLLLFQADAAKAQKTRKKSHFAKVLGHVSGTSNIRR
jgi:hypothetical protein